MAERNRVDATSLRSHGDDGAPRGFGCANARVLGLWSPFGAVAASLPHVRARARLTQLLSRLCVCLLLALPSLLFTSAWPTVERAFHRVGMQVTPSAAHFVLFSLSATAAVWGALPVHQRALGQLAARRCDQSQLASLALVLSVLVAASPSPQESSARPPDASFFVLAPLLSALVLLGALLEGLFRRSAYGAAHHVVRLTPATSRRLDASGQEELVATADVRAGEHIRVRPREIVPLDGSVLEGRSLVLEQPVTGEPLPVDKRAGATVIGGTQNGRGVLTIRVSRPSSGGALSAIARAVQSAARTRSESEEQARRVSHVLVWVTLILALSGGALLVLSDGPLELRRSLLLCTTILVVASPEALILSAFLASRAGLVGAMRVGLLAESARSLEALARVDTIVVGKTGTLTEARARVVSVVGDGDTSEAALLSLASGLVGESRDPFAHAIRTRVATLSAPTSAVQDVTALPGCGYLGRRGSSRVGLGNHGLLALLGAHDVTLEAKANALCDHGQTVLFVVDSGRVRGLVGCVDPLRLTTRDALAELGERGVRPVLCTADTRRTALHLATQLGIAEVVADVPPAEKVGVVRKLSAEGARVAFAGRSPLEETALARAQVGIALSLVDRLDRETSLLAGAQAALPREEATSQDATMTRDADVRVELVDGDLAAVARAISLSHTVVNSGRRAFWLGVGFHLLALPLTAGIFGPLAHISVAASTPLLAGCAQLACFLLLSGHAHLLRRAQF